MSPTARRAGTPKRPAGYQRCRLHRMSLSPSNPDKEAIELSDGESPIYADTPFGHAHAIVTLVTFLGCWGYAIALWGWFIGLGLGWIPAAVISWIVFSFLPAIVFLALIAVIVIAVLVLWG